LRIGCSGEYVGLRGRKWQETGEDYNELHILYASPNVVRVIKLRKMRWVEHVACMGKMRNEYKIRIRKPEKKRPIRRPRCNWEDKIRIDLEEIWWEGIDWIHLAQDSDQ
jgi:hypothetical protein